MDHVEVRQWLADALAGGLLPSLLDVPVTPGAGAGGDMVAADAARAHLASCPACRAEAGALVTTGALLAAATPDDVLAPVAARERILRSVRETGMVRTQVATALPVVPQAPVRRRWRLLPALAAAAMAVVIVGGLAMVGSIDQQASTAHAEVAALAELATASGHILARPDHAQLSLTAADGTTSGTIVFSPSSGQVAVWSLGLAGTASGTRYDCYLAHGSALTLIGWMDYAGNVAYWVGNVPAGVSLGRAGDRILVQAEAPGAAPAMSGTF
ncbi:MAG TPA: hypothetical protein VMH24_00675 [Candidatus Sulfotelmatobacter sp.]|nr:hypothetical protein [Candidatus Sulfotelmatobacter sp.]